MRKRTEKQANRKTAATVLKKAPKPRGKMWHEDAIIHQNILFADQAIGSDFIVEKVAARGRR